MLEKGTRQIEGPPTISVVIAAYNEENEILNVLAEIEKQTFQDFEILVIDDGSTDSTLKIATEHLQWKKNAHVVPSDHRGPAHAYNVGIREARGDIIFIAESDCVYDADYLELAVRSLEANPSANAVCLTGGPLMVKSTLATECLLIENTVQHRLLRKGRIKPFYAWVFKKEAIRRVGGFDERLHQAEDKDLFRRFVHAGNTIAWVPGIHWRHKRDQTMAQLAHKHFDRGRSRAMFVLKHHMVLDLLRKLGPLWAFIATPVIWVISPLASVFLILVILFPTLARTLFVVVNSWPEVRAKRFFLGYPIFLLVRNLATGLGYTVGIILMTVRRLRGQQISWQNV